MTESDKSLIIRLWNGGVPVTQIPKMLPYKLCEGKAMVAELRANGTLAPRTRESKQELVASAYRNGMKNPYEIAETYGLTYTTVRHYLLRSGIKRPYPKKQYRPKGSQERTKQILAALSEKSQSEVARQFGVSRQYVSALKKRMEWEK